MKPLEVRLAEAWPPSRWSEVTALVAVSGGADSVALLRALTALRTPAAGRLIVAHFNHALRGAESDADERFVVALARELDVECRVGRADRQPKDTDDIPAAEVHQHETLASNDVEKRSEDADDPAGDKIAQPSTSTSTSEQRARALRYEFLVATARACGARYVATAHTADDQAETVLHHMLRGTGLAGLSGMSNARELAPGIALVRPLLGVRRAEVVAYLADLGQSFREDSTNRDTGYTRNRLRHDLLPRLAADYNPRVVEALVRLSALAGEAQQTVEAQAAAIAARCVVSSDAARVTIDTTVLAAEPRSLAREALIAIWRAQNWPLQAMTFEHWERLAALAVDPAPARPTKQVLPGEIIAERAGTRLTLQGGRQSAVASWKMRPSPYCLLPTVYC